MGRVASGPRGAASALRGCRFLRGAESSLPPVSPTPRHAEELRFGNPALRSEILAAENHVQHPTPRAPAPSSRRSRGASTGARHAGVDRGIPRGQGVAGDEVARQSVGWIEGDMTAGTPWPGGHDGRGALGGGHAALVAPPARARPAESCGESRPRRRRPCAVPRRVSPCHVICHRQELSTDCQVPLSVTITDWRAFRGDDVRHSLPYPLAA